MPAFVDTGLNLVHVDDVAEGHFLALERGRTGENYILGGADVTLAQMLADIAALAGRRAPKVKLPRGPLFPLAFAAEAAARLTGKEPFLTADALRMSRYRMYFSSAKAERELGYAARPYREGLKDAMPGSPPTGIWHDRGPVVRFPAAGDMALSAAGAARFLAAARTRYRARGRARDLAVYRGGGAGPQRSGCDPAQHRQSSGAGLSRRFPRRTGGRPVGRRHRRSGAGAEQGSPDRADGRRAPAGLDGQALGDAPGRRFRGAVDAGICLASPMPISPMRQIRCARWWRARRRGTRCWSR